MSSRRRHKSDSLGLKTLYQPRSDLDALVDIVLVHGLRGKGNRTWTKHGVLWPRDLLANDVPHARIMTWGYDADVMKFFGVGPTGRGNIRDHAKTLNRDLAGERFEEHQVQRPIIFVAHSLGGLVVKYALFLSKETPANLDRGVAAIKEATKGILFAGTPHRGSDKATWLATATKLAAFLQKDRSPVLVDTLERGSQVLEILQDCFQRILEDFTIYSLIEEMPYPRIGKIVEKDSALIGWNEREVLIHANHSNMVKFESAHDQNYKRLRNCVQEIIRDKVEGDVTRATASRRMLKRSCTCSTHQETLVAEDSSPNSESRPQDVKAFSHQDSGKLNSRSSTRRSLEAPLKSSDSEGLNFKFTEIMDTSLFSQEEAAAIAKANKHFLRALDILTRLPNPDPAGMVRTLHLIMSVRIEMSYNRGLSSDERLSHLQKARAYSQDALEYALKSSQSGDMALVKLYQAILSAREVEVSVKRMTASEARSRKEEAVEEISRSLRELSKSRNPDSDRHYAWAQAWRDKFLKTSKAVGT